MALRNYRPPVEWPIKYKRGGGPYAPYNYPIRLLAARKFGEGVGVCLRGGGALVRIHGHPEARKTEYPGVH